ncbi:MAG TPA: hypothetical protein HPQ00_00325 [Magnetococcales bacterium]|nr:hypothetical protein [Magnetococcales bacterium]
MSKNKIHAALKSLNLILMEKEIKGEILIFGGAAMILAFDARPATKDVDAIFKPKTAMIDAIKRIAEELHLPEDWLNDAVKGFTSSRGDTRLLFGLPNLAIYVPTTEYLLAMKALSARVDSADKDDFIFLVEKLGLKSVASVFCIVEKYYPKNRIKPATQFFIEEIMDNVNR